MQGFGFNQVPLGQARAGEVLEAPRDQRMVGSQGAFPDGERLPVEGLSRLGLAEVEAKDAEVVEALGNSGMVVAEHGSPRGEGLLEQDSGRLQLTLGCQRSGEVAEGLQQYWVPRWEVDAQNLDRPRVEGLRLARAATREVQVGEIVEGHREVGVLGVERCCPQLEGTLELHLGVLEPALLAGQASDPGGLHASSRMDCG